MTHPAADLVSATRLFLARHEEALASGDGARTLEAAEGLLEAFERTLPAEIEALRRVHAHDAPPPDVRALASLDEASREAWAHAVLQRRLAECEGLLLQVRLMLQTMEEGQGDAFRFVAALTATRTVLRGLDAALLAWADALGARGRHQPLPAPRPASWACARAAREALLAGAPEAAAPALRVALFAGLAAPLGRTPFSTVDQAIAAWGAELPTDAAHVRAVVAALDAGTADPVAGWALLDEVDAIAQRASMTHRSP